jgi:predicted RND superfamily exporter protein
VVAGALILFAMSIYYTGQVSYSHNVLSWINEKEKITADVPYIDTHLNGTIMLEVILDTGKTDGLKDPLFLSQLQAFKQKIMAYADAHLYVGKVYAIDDIIMEVNQSLNGNDPKSYAVPQIRAAVSQELLLFENSGSDDLERFTDRDYRVARVSIKTPWTDAVYLKIFVAHVQALAKSCFPDGTSNVVTGIPARLSRSIPASLHSMAKSYVAAFLVITLLMIIHVGNFKIGLLSMISNLLPIFMTMGIMGVFHIRLDMSTIMIGSIAIGIVVDDTLHFMYNFRKYFDQTGDASLAIEKTMLGTGRALLLTSVILSAGFFILMTASLSLLVVFGWLTGLTIVFALLADFIVNPALMVLVTGKHPHHSLGGPRLRRNRVSIRSSTRNKFGDQQ